METLKDIFTYLVPEQEEGISITAEHSRTAGSEEEAQQLFDTAKELLADIWNWSALSGAAGADFAPVNHSGNLQTDGLARPGLLIRINIPGPGTQSGGGYDWVSVEEVEDVVATGASGFGIRVRPAAAPGSSGKGADHFYAAESTSTFMVYRFETQVKAMIMDRNTQVNKQADKLLDRVRNIVIGTGAITLFSKMQWQHMCKALLYAG